MEKIVNRTLAILVVMLLMYSSFSNFLTVSGDDPEPENNFNNIISVPLPVLAEEPGITPENLSENIAAYNQQRKNEMSIIYESPNSDDTGLLCTDKSTVSLIAGGYYGNDAYICHLDNDGNIVWDQTYHTDYGRAIIFGINQGYAAGIIITGSVEMAFIVQFNAETGDLLNDVIWYYPEYQQDVEIQGIAISNTVNAIYLVGTFDRNQGSDIIPSIIYYKWSLDLNSCIWQFYLTGDDTSVWGSDILVDAWGNGYLGGTMWAGNMPGDPSAYMAQFDPKLPEN